MTTAPHWLVQSYSTFDSGQQSQALAWTHDNLEGDALKNAYRFARYYRPAMNRNNQFLVDQIGLKVQQQTGGGMAGYANYAPAMSGYSMGAYMPTMGAGEGEMTDAEFNAWYAKNHPGELTEAEGEAYYAKEQAQGQAQGQGAGAPAPKPAGGDGGFWGAISNIFGMGTKALQSQMQNQPGGQTSPGGMTPGMWGTTAAQQAATWGTAASSQGVVAKQGATPPAPAKASSWIMPVALVAGVGVLAYAVLKK